jgi:heme oxygenase (biliverdin-IX-beta and delta-forming)
MDGMTLRNALRAGTAEYHAVVDSLFGRFDMSDRRQYGTFLTAHARALSTVETALEHGGIERLVPDWADRRRAAMLSADLHALDLPAPPLLPFAGFSSEDALWGAAYVLEGSKLGGAMLAKRVPAHFPSTYLAFQGPKGAMKAFMDRLDENSAVDQSRAIAAARTVFAAFRAAAELELEILVT